MSDASKNNQTIMRRAAPDDEITIRYALPAGIISQTNVGHAITTCLNGTIDVPKSLASPLHKGPKADVIVLEAKMRRDVAAVISSLVAEVVRLTRELDGFKAKA